MISRIHQEPQTAPLPPQTTQTSAPRRSAEGSSFQTAIDSLLRQAAGSGQSNANFVSPFNPTGRAPSTTLAPTAVEVAANPDRYAGTSFDPARQLNYNFPLQRETFGSPAPATAPAPAGPATTDPPPGSRPTRDANVFVTASGATWNRPGTTPVSQTSADYDRWRLNTFGVSA